MKKNTKRKRSRKTIILDVAVKVTSIVALISLETLVLTEPKSTISNIAFATSVVCDIFLCLYGWANNDFSDLFMTEAEVEERERTKAKHYRK